LRISDPQLTANTRRKIPSIAHKYTSNNSCSGVDFLSFRWNLYLEKEKEGDTVGAFGAYNYEYKELVGKVTEL